MLILPPKKSLLLLWCWGWGIGGAGGSAAVGTGFRAVIDFVGADGAQGWRAHGQVSFGKQGGGGSIRCRGLRRGSGGQVLAHPLTTGEH